MIHRFLTPVVALLALPCVAVPAPIVVRSGEHGDFTRLVLQVTPDLAWRATSGEQQFSLHLQDQKDGYDISSVFQRITRQRIGSVTTSSSGLVVGLNCDCPVEVFRAGPRLLVLDVSDPTPDAQRAIAQPYLFPSRSDNRLSFGAAVVSGPDPEVSEPSTAVSDRAEVKPADADPFAGLPWPERSVPGAPDISITAPDVGDVSRDAAALASLDQARSQLAEQFSVASTRGLLKPEQSFPTLPIGGKQAQVDTSIFDSSETPRGESEAVTLSSNVRVSTSSDIVGNPREQTPSTSLGVQCFDPELLSVGDWGTSDTLQSALGKARSELYGEFDRPNPAAVLNLTRIYLHYGFGAEAIATLRIDKGVSDKHPELEEIADILEFGAAREDAALPAHTECDSPAALWAILASTALSDQQSVNLDAALLALNALPLHLRRILAPELSRKILMYGDKQAADMALRTLDRLPETPDMQAVLARADLDLADGDTQAAERKLEKVVDSNSVQSARALITLIDTEMLSGRDVDASTAQLAEAYSLELRDHKLGAEMRRVHILALAKSGQFDAAFGALAVFATDAGEQTRKQLLSLLLNLTTKKAPDAVFVRHVFRELPIETNSASGPVRIAIATRLVSLGFANEALAVLEEDEDLYSSRKGRLLRAEISLGLGRPEAVAAALFEITGDEADMLRALANGQAGRRTEAAEGFRELNDTRNADANAWLSDSWKELMPQDDPVFGGLVSVANAPSPDPTISEGLLNRTENALSDSASARAAVLEILKKAE